MDLKTYKKIDIHVHTGMWGEVGLDRGGMRSTNPAKIRQMYDEHGVDFGVLLPGANPECCHSMQPNELCYITVNNHPETFIWFCNIDPRNVHNDPRCNLSLAINRYKAMGAKGIGEVMASLPVDDPLCQNLFYHAGECGMPVTIHISPGRYGYYGLIEDYGLPRLEYILKKFPKCKIFGHSSMFWAHISGDLTPKTRLEYPSGPVTEGGKVVELMRKYENLDGDLSAGSGYTAMSRDPEFAYKFIEEFRDRLFFGTDICSAGDQLELSGWLDDALLCGGISEETYRMVCRENAIRVLGLKVPKK